MSTTLQMPFTKASDAENGVFDVSRIQSYRLIQVSVIASITGVQNVGHGNIWTEAYISDVD